MRFDLDAELVHKWRLDSMHVLTLGMLVALTSLNLGRPLCPGNWWIYIDTHAKRIIGQSEVVVPISYLVGTRGLGWPPDTIFVVFERSW